MILVALVGIFVGTETFALGIVVVIGGAACPAMTLDAKVIVALAGELAPARPRLKHALSKGDACGYAVFLHLLDGEILILVDVFLIGGVPFHLCRQSDWHREKNSKKR